MKKLAAFIIWHLYFWMLSIFLTDQFRFHPMIIFRRGCVKG